MDKTPEFESVPIEQKIAEQVENIAHNGTGVFSFVTKLSGRLHQVQAEVVDEPGGPLVKFAEVFEGTSGRREMGVMRIFTSEQRRDMRQKTDMRFLGWVKEESVAYPSAQLIPRRELFVQLVKAGQELQKKKQAGVK